MDGKGWKPHYGISKEGIDLLGYVEALPAEARRELVAAVAELCRSQGYLSLHDDLQAAVDGMGDAPAEEEATAKVIPLFTRLKRC
jgi:hypothetical protein